MELTRLPDELKSLPQWVVASADKRPRHPKTGRAASVIDPTTWGTFDEAVAAGYPLIGFVLTRDDPYAFVDLDAPRNDEERERHRRILDAFAGTYAERSQSGHGVHIYCRGSVPSGVKRDHVEVYSCERYMIVTGDVVHDQPITEQQALLDTLHYQMYRATQLGTELEEVEGSVGDAELVAVASNAVNGEKFTSLCNGDWQSEYPSQSEADFALLSMLAFYTRDNTQVRRLFRLSALGKRDKAQRDDYLNRSLAKIRANEPPPVDFSQLQAPPVVVRQNGKKPAMPEPEPLDFPPGLPGEIARYVYATSLRPVKEVSIAAGIALTAGICGRQFNISKTGLNVYLIVLARTGTGKEELARGIDRLLAAVRQQVPMIDQFVGPAVFSSGQSIVRALDDRHCLVSVAGEIGLRLQEISDPRNSLNIAIKRVLLDVYAKSGYADVLHPTVYSDAQKNTKLVQSPCLSIVGESTPETFYAALSPALIMEGLVPRFCILEYTGDRPELNPRAGEPPPPELIARITEVAVGVLQMQQNNYVWHMQADADAQALLDAFNMECDERIRSSQDNALRELWNRAHLKALRLSALCAIRQTPLVTVEDARWSINVVRRDILTVTQRFEEGDVGEGDSKLVADLRRVIQDFLRRPFSDLEKYGATEKMKVDGVMPYAYLLRRTSNLAAYKNSKVGATVALKNSLKSLEETAELTVIPKPQMQQRYGTSQVGYYATGY